MLIGWLTCIPAVLLSQSPNRRATVNAHANRRSAYSRSLTAIKKNKMEQHFNSSDYINHLANELIRNFSYASFATTPVLVGTAREKEVIRKLELLLPKFVGVGSGCIIDSFGNTSKQMDIVLYEKDYCPVFCINESPETTYYPCEGVIAVGEVKSVLNTKELSDIFSKMKSVKLLKRYSQPCQGGIRGTYYSYRSFGSRTSFEGAVDEDYDQLNKSTDQIFCFALCGELEISTKTLADRFETELKQIGNMNEVNFISILNYGIVAYYNQEKNNLTTNFKDGGAFFISQKRENNFEYLLTTLNNIIHITRTVDTKTFNRYITSNSNLLVEIGRKVNIS